MKKSYYLEKSCLSKAYLLALAFTLSPVVQALAGPAESNLGGIYEKTQESKIIGKVTDKQGEVIPGASVIVKGTTIGTTTDLDGNYTLENVPANGTLVFSFIGMKSIEVNVTGKKQINVTMLEDAIGLDEVVAIGYGVAKKSDVTGATSTVKADEMVKRPLIRIEQALQGTTSGVVVVSNSGQPGQGMSVKIRGANSITGSSDPLYVIDGFIGGSIESLNPNDIASMEILKDASATAIYGSRGSNGVVLITTKSGQEGGIKIDFNTWFSNASIPKHLDLMDAYNFAQVVNTTNIATGGSAAFTDAQLQDFKQWGGTDWHNELERKPWIKNYDLNVSGGTESVKYRVSLNHLDQPGLILNQYYRKTTFRSNLDIKANSRLDLKFNVFVLMPESRNTGYSGDLTDPFSQANIWDPTSHVRNEDGSYIKNSVYGSNGFNPIAQANGQKDDNSSTQLTGTGSLTYKILKGLSFTANGSYTRNSVYNQAFRGTDTDEGSTNGTRATVDANKSWSFQNSNFLTYNGIFGSHAIAATLLYEQQRYEINSVRANSVNLSTESLTYYNLGLGSTQLTTSGYSQDALQSYMARINYTFKERYMLTASYRIDGSSHLTDKYSHFPSVAVGWNIARENFLEDSNIVSSLKLRASYGETGNQAVGAYATIPRISTGGPYYYDGATSSVTTPLGAPVSPSLKWEHTKQTDIGVDGSLYNGRLTFGVDVYNKDITDLLYNYQAPFYMGGDSYQRNMGEINNKGFELSIGGVPVSSKDWSWNTNFTLSFNRNKVVDLMGLDNIPVNNIGSAQTGVSYLKVGRPLGEFYGYEFLGTWKNSEVTEAAKFGMKPGDAKYTDVNGDKAYTTDDLLRIGNGSPDFSFGFINDIRYKDFSLSLMFQGMSGNQIYSQTMAYLWGGQGQAKTPTTVEALKMWTSANETENPAFSSTSKNFINSSRYVYDASFIKLKNISFTYNVPKKWLNSFCVDHLEVYVSGQNLFTITDYPGYDPEINNAQNALTQGLEMGVIPNPRTYTFGLRVGF